MRHTAALTNKTMRLIDAVMGVEQVNLNAPLMAKNHAAWKAECDKWIADPASSTNPRLWDMLATFEWALKQPEMIFKPQPIRGWMFTEIIACPPSAEVMLVAQMLREREEHEATHRCIICRALWRSNPPSRVQPEGSWSLVSAKCGPCCDNVAMGDQIEELPKPGTGRAALLTARQQVDAAMVERATIEPSLLPGRLPRGTAPGDGNAED